jgi:hypothetical protein
MADEIERETRTVQQSLKRRSEALKQDAEAKQEDSGGGILDRARVYLSGPMDFVPSREEEKANGWRTRVSEFLTQRMGTTVFDPWNKPEVSGMQHYGKEDEFTVNRRGLWTYEDDDEGRRLRDSLCEEFWPTLHIDLRMTDLADFLIAYTPTNVYSVGTVHEIATARMQHKPVLMVTPQLEPTPQLEALQSHLRSRDDADGIKLLEEMRKASSDRPNPTATPSLWYMAMLEHEDYFFDGFGFAEYFDLMKWTWYDPLDGREQRNPPKRPLLPYLESLNREIPKRFDNALGREIENPEWLIFQEPAVVRRSPARGGAGT